MNSDCLMAAVFASNNVLVANAVDLCLLLELAPGCTYFAPLQLASERDNLLLFSLKLH